MFRLSDYEAVAEDSCLGHDGTTEASLSTRSATGTNCGQQGAGKDCSHNDAAEQGGPLSKVELMPDMSSSIFQQDGAPARRSRRCSLRPLTGRSQYGSVERGSRRPDRHHWERSNVMQNIQEESGRPQMCRSSDSERETFITVHELS